MKVFNFFEDATDMESHSETGDCFCEPLIGFGKIFFHSKIKAANNSMAHKGKDNRGKFGVEVSFTDGTSQHFLTNGFATETWITLFLSSNRKASVNPRKVNFIEEQDIDNISENERVKRKPYVVHFMNNVVKIIGAESKENSQWIVLKVRNGHRIFLNPENVKYILEENGDE